MRERLVLLADEVYQDNIFKVSPSLLSHDLPFALLVHYCRLPLHQVFSSVPGVCVDVCIAVDLCC